MSSETAPTTYKFWCAYCGLEMTLSQQSTPTPEQQVCTQCRSILDTYEHKEINLKLEKLEKLHSLLHIQGHEGNWNLCEYTRGLYNGMELVTSIIEDRHPVFKEFQTPSKIDVS